MRAQEPEMNQPSMNQSRSLGAETICDESNRLIAVPTPSTDDRTQSNFPTKQKNVDQDSTSTSVVSSQTAIDDNNEKKNKDKDDTPDNNPKLTRKHNTERLHSNLTGKLKKKPQFKRTHSCPAELKYDDCREFDSFAGIISYI